MSIEKLGERPKSLTAIAKESIRRAIVEGDLAFGSQLSENVLASQLGVSKTPVREALVQLKLEGLVEVQPQSGTYVFQPTEAQVREICRFREIVESSALELAMKADHAGLAATLGATLARAHGSQDWRARDQDAAFHGAIVEACGNSYLQQAYQLVADKIQALRARLSVADESVDSCQDTHAHVMELIREGNAKKACAELRAHIRSTEHSYLRASQMQPSEAGA
ncbi:GntR family transcriptional regulator [Paraburkholderia acidisoli]|nr:GntR family transcriptional regulator [Paraburkholderia acidisoli]